MADDVDIIVAKKQMIMNAKTTGELNVTLNFIFYDLDMSLFTDRYSR